MKRIFFVIISVLTVLNAGIVVSAQDDGETFPQVPGRIAYVGADLNIHSLDLINGKRMMLTEDAEIRARSARFYQWPTWSTDGRLAYFRSTLTAPGTSGNLSINLDAFISVDGIEVGGRAYSGSGETFTYAYWSPGNCASGGNCRDLAVLLSGAEGLFVEMIRDSFEGASSRLIGQGAPFYYSWSPDGLQMLWQRFGQRIDIYDVASGDVVETISQAPGFFQAPDWSPVDNRLLFGSLGQDGASTDLVIVESEEVQTIVPGLDGLVYFAWAPDSNAIAYTNSAGPLTIVDAKTGDIIAHSPVSGVLAFFWAPDSQKIAYITRVSSGESLSVNAGTSGVLAAYQQQDSPLSLAWSVIDISSGENHRYEGFVPTRDMIYLLTYFDQFAQSHRVWSPDSTHLIYSEQFESAFPAIQILDIREKNSTPVTIAEGLIGIWSFE